jgi:hypothetical protein
MKGGAEMPWKKNDDGTFAVDDKGNPVFVLEDGNEKNVDYLAMTRSLSEANTESRKRREALKELEAKYKPYEDAKIDNIAEYVKAYEDAQTQLAAYKAGEGKVESEKLAAQKSELEKAFAAKESGLKAQIDALNSRADKAESLVKDTQKQLQDNRISQFFNGSTFAKEKCNASPRILESLFKQYCDFDENGAFLGKDADGETVYSTSDGKQAGFEDWLSHVVTKHPDANTYLLKGSKTSGAGGSPLFGPGGNANPFMKDTYNLTEQGKILVDNPAEGRALAKAAGIDLPEF